MSNWRRGSIGELAKGYRGVTYSAGQLCEFKTPSTVTLLRSNNITNGRLNFDEVQIVPDRLVSEDQILGPGDLAVCMSNGSKALVGKAAPFPGSIGERFTVGAFCSVFRPMPHSVSTFVGRLFQSSEYRRHLDLALAGTAINNLRNCDIEAFSCDIPPVEDQRKIAEVLDTMDTAIHETEVIIAKLTALKQGLLDDLLTRGIDANGELRLPQAEVPHLYKPSPLGWIPKEWEVAPLGELSESLIDGPFGSNLKTAHYVENPGVRVVRLQNILSGEYDDSERAFISERHAAFLERNRVTAGDALIASLGDASYPVGRSCCYPPDLPDAINKADCFRFRGGPRCRNQFVMHSMNGSAARKQVRGYEQGVTMKRINLGNLRRIEIALPSIPEQDAIVERLNVTQLQVDATSLQLQKLRYEKFGLMDDLLTGRVRVPPLISSDVRQDG